MPDIILGLADPAVNKAKIPFPQSLDCSNGEFFNKDIKYIVYCIITGSAEVTVRPRRGTASAKWGQSGCCMRKDLTEKMRNLSKLWYILTKEKG